jgi:hypothetical protein
MDDYWVDFASDEDTDDDYLYWNHFVHFEQLNQYDARTDLVAADQPRSAWNDGTDVVWFATGDLPLDILGDEVCRAVHLVTLKCDRARVRFNEAWTRLIPDNAGFFVACHEFGHAYGFEHNNDACMITGEDPWSDPISGTLSSHMIDHINTQY